MASYPPIPSSYQENFSRERTTARPPIQTESSFELKSPTPDQAVNASKALAAQMNVSPSRKRDALFAGTTTEDLREMIENRSPDLSPDDYDAAFKEIQRRQETEHYFKLSDRKWSDPTTWLASDWLLVASTGLDFLSGRAKLKQEKEIADRSYSLNVEQFQERLKLDREKLEWEKYMHGPAVTSKNLNVFV